ncbi:hypothetical protein ABK040_001948 [Willaertia magna]
MQEERQVKKRKSLLKYYFTLEILFEITKYFNDPKNYVYLAQTCKYFYEVMLMKENYLFKQFNEILFNNYKLQLTNDLPNYLFKLKKLHINGPNSDYNLLQKFINVVALKTNNLFGKYLEYLPNLEELSVNRIYNYDEDTFTNLKQLKVLSLSLYDNGLQDKWLRNLNNLTQFSISKSLSLTGSCLQYFKNLTCLKFAHCREMNDDLLLNCKQLTNIEVPFSNNLFGNCFKQLKELKYLNIRHCDRIKDECLNNLNNLESLNIRGCKKITGTCLQNLQQLQLLTIDISSETQLKYLNHLINLKKLDIIIFQVNEKYNEIRINTSFLLNLVNLEELYLENYDKILYRDKDFYNLKKLKILNISYTESNSPEFTGKCFQYFENLENLICNLKFEVKYLNYLPNINYLYLKEPGEPEEPIYFKEFSHLTQLKTVELHYMLLYMNDDLKDLQLFKNLKRIKIFNSTVNGDFNNLPNLTTLELYDVEIKDKQIVNLENLTKLIIEGCSSITGECFINLKQLQDLVIFASNINFKYLSNLKKLTRLNISDSEIEDKDLMELNNIQYLNVTNCTNLVGTFLLNMNKLIQMDCLGSNVEILNKFEIDKLKEKITKGKTFEKAVDYVLNTRE